MKKVIFIAVVLFMYTFGIVLSLDLALVLDGHFTLRSYPEYDMEWHDSPIFGYNISRAANTLIGAIAFACFFGGTMYWLCIVNPLFKEERYIKAVRRRTAKWNKEVFGFDNLQSIVFILIVTAVSLSSCTGCSHSGRLAQEKAEAEAIAEYEAEDARNAVLTGAVPAEEEQAYNNRYIIQVIHPNGFIENIEDKKKVRPVMGANLILCEHYSLLPDSSVYSDYYIWGYWTPTAEIPKDIEADSLTVRYFKVRVIKPRIN